MKAIEIPYSKNWNNKLQCEVYTTIRVWNPTKYQKGRTFHAMLNGKLHHTGTIEDVRKIFFKDMHDWVTRLDANLSSEEFKNMMRKMYQAKLNPDTTIEETPFIWVLCKRNL
jgi:hypothetical protein